jgi:Fic family protein
MNEGIRLLNDGLPLSGRMLRDIHAVLMTGSRGGERTPGEFRRSQNWIGGTRPGNALFVPPPPEEVPELIADLERFFHAEDHLPKLIKAGVSHVQFETIHPFLDGNGRLGRLLITFFLYHEKILSEPLLYISLFLKTHRRRYYELLQEVRLSGAWEAWLAFFLEGIEQTANQAAQTATRALRMFEADKTSLQTWGRSAGTALRVHAWLQAHPITTVKDCVRGTGLTAPPVGKALEGMTSQGIVKELTGRKRDRVFAYQSYLTLLTADVEAAADARPS